MTDQPFGVNLTILPAVKPPPYEEYVAVIIGSGVRIVETAGNSPKAFMEKFKASGKIAWFHQYTPNDNRDYDETGAHVLIDTKVNGEDRKILAHAARNRREPLDIADGHRR